MQHCPGRPHKPSGVVPCHSPPSAGSGGLGRRVISAAPRALVGNSIVEAGGDRLPGCESDAPRHCPDSGCAPTNRPCFSRHPLVPLPSAGGLPRLDIETCEGGATIGLELIQAVPPFDAVLVALGGGALATGVGHVMKALFNRRVIRGRLGP